MSYRPPPQGAVPQQAPPPPHPHPHPHQQVQSVSQSQPRRRTDGYGEDIDEAGGIGDELDSISMRDVASVRYVRHHEWMELVLGSTVPTSKILPPKVIPEKTPGGVWQFEDAESVNKLVEDLTRENDQLEKELAESKPNEKEQFYKQGILKLRNEFGKPGTVADEELVQELESKYPGHSVIEKKRVRQVHGELGLPEPQKKDPNFVDARKKPESVEDTDMMENSNAVPQTTLQQEQEQEQDPQTQSQQPDPVQQEPQSQPAMEDASMTNEQQQGEDQTMQDAPVDLSQEFVQQQPASPPLQQPTDPSPLQDMQSQDDAQQQSTSHPPQPEMNPEQAQLGNDSMDVTMGQDTEPNTAGDLMDDDLSDVLNM